MGKFFFPALGVGFSELRQTALTFCHSSVTGSGAQISRLFAGRYLTFAA